MFDSIWIDVAIGLITVFLVFSLVVSGVREVISVVLATRSKNLWNQLSTLLDEEPTNERPDNQGVKKRAARTGGFFSPQTWGRIGHRILNWFKGKSPRPQTQAQPRLVSAAGAQAAGVAIAGDVQTAELSVDQIVRLLRKEQLEAWQALYAHPFVRNLDLTNAAAIKTRLSHIPSRDFARTMLDLFLTAGEDMDLVFEDLQEALTSAGVQSPGAAELDAAKAAVLALSRPAAATDVDAAFQAVDTAVAALGQADQQNVAAAVAEAKAACSRYAAAEKDWQKIENGIGALLPESSGLRRVAHQLVGEAGDKLGDIRDTMSDWFDNHMKALSTSYRTRTRVWGFFIGLAVVIPFNVDSIGLGRDLYGDQQVRSAVVSLGQDLVDDLDLTTDEGACAEAVTTDADDEDGGGEEEEADIEEVLENQRNCIAERASQISDTGLPLGLDGFGDYPVWQRLIGWVLTAAALSFGATFWYDLLKRLLGLRRRDAT